MSADPAAVNREHWDALAAVHGEGDETYDVEALVRGERDLREAEAAAAGDVRGLDVLHVQCHIGFDTVALARRGARVTGADFSPASLAKARAIAERCGVEIEWVEADSRALPASLHGRFDVVYATIGVLSWIDDVAAWMRSAAAALRPGGRLVLVEIHPLLTMVASREPLAFDFPYADDGPREFDEPGSYAGADLPVAATRTIEHAHSIGEVVTAALEAGLRVEALREDLDADQDPRGGLLARGEDGRYRLDVGGQRLPVLYTLVAARP